MLSAAQVESFVNEGFVHAPSVISSEVIDACVEDVWSVLREEGITPDPSTWPGPVKRINCPETENFARAGTTPVLWEAYDQLLGADRWWKRQGVGGTIPVRFPGTDDPGDAGWHIESSYSSGAEWRTNVFSRGRGLLVLFLLTDITDEDAPIRIRVGSHRDVPRILEPAGEEGLSGAMLSPLVDEASARRQIAYASGRAGDVYLCHPFLVHAATWPHRGAKPRMIAQPGVALLRPFSLQPGSAAGPVERAIIASL